MYRQKISILFSIKTNSDFISKIKSKKKKSIQRNGKIVIPSFIKTIRPNTFYNFANSENETIEENAFRSLSFKEISLPKSVKIIGKECFCDCKNYQKSKFQKIQNLDSFMKKHFIEQILKVFISHQN